MEFLSSVRPKIDFRNKAVTVECKGKIYQLPTVSLVNGKIQPLTVDNDDNQFADLPIDRANEEIDHGAISGDIDTFQLVGSGGDDSLEIAGQKRVKIQCMRCTRVMTDAKSSKLCSKCENHSQEHLKGNFKEVNIGEHVETCGKGQQQDIKNQQQANNVEIVSLNVFKNGLRGNRYRNCGLLNLMQLSEHVDADMSDDVAVVKNQQDLNFTHRSTLGGGDDADISRGDKLQLLARQQLDVLKTKYSSVFEEPQYPVDRSNCPMQFEHTIPLKDESLPPPKRKLYPLDAIELEELKKQIELFLETNRISPANGPYGAPILFAKKKDGGLRMCIDYRLLNGQTQPDVFPLPRIDELLQRLDGATIFSKLDLRDGYHQIGMHGPDRIKTSFTCRYGTFMFNVMPFGLNNAPATFQRAMNQVFFKLLDNGVLCYLDDLLIYSKDVESHKKLLDEVFQLLQVNKLYIKEKKCHLFLNQVNFLGHVVDSRGVSLESGKVDVIRDWPAPTNVNQVQQFLGLCNYYRRFVLRFSEIASPLSQLTRKGIKFKWEDQQQHSFDQLKQCLISAPVLKVFDPARKTRVVCDASDFCVGAVLEQCFEDAWHPIEFYSKRLNSAQRNYSATDREFVAVQQSLERWRHFLVSITFELLTDHAALTYLHSTQHVSRRNARWLDFLSGFNFTISHIKGKENVIADALSRVPGSEQLSSLALCSGFMTLGIIHQCDLPYQRSEILDLCGMITIFENRSFLKSVRSEQQECSSQWFLKLKDKAKHGDIQYQYQQGVLCKIVGDKHCPIIPDRTSNLVNVILSELHESALSGHFGSNKMLKMCQKRFYWQNMFKSVENYISRCQVCQSNKHSTLKPAGLMQPVENPSVPFAHVNMDFITSLPISNRGFDAIFTVVDRFSRLVRFIPCNSSMSAVQCAHLFFEHWVCLYGMPSKIVSDRDVKFQSKFWQTLMKLLDCRLAMSTAYHPQTDGLSERFHRSIEQVLRCYCSSQQQAWCSVLRQCEFALNSSFQESVGTTPFKVVYGFEPHLPIDVHLAPLQMPSVVDFVSARSELQLQVQQALKASQERIKAQADRRRRHSDVAVDQEVWLATKNLPLRTGTRKLAPLWTGPFRVVAEVAKEAYKLDLPSNWAIHDVFHRSQLKPATSGEVYKPLPLALQDGVAEFEVEAILNERVVRGQTQVLVKWLGFDFYENTWEPLKNVQNAPEILAEFRARQQRTRRGSSVT